VNLFRGLQLHREKIIADLIKFKAKM